MKLSKEDKKALAGIGIALVAAYAEQSLKRAGEKEKDEWKRLGYSISEDIARDAKENPDKYYEEGVKIYTAISKRTKKKRKTKKSG